MDDFWFYFSDIKMCYRISHKTLDFEFVDFYFGGGEIEPAEMVAMCMLNILILGGNKHILKEWSVFTCV